MTMGTNTLLLQINQVSDTLADTSGVTPHEKTISIWELIASGGWYIMIPLGLLSIATIYIFLERLMAINQANKQERDFLNKLRDHIKEGKIEAAKEVCYHNDNPIARMLLKGIKRIGKPMKDISSSIENIAKLEVYKLEKNLSTLATIAGVAPMIGFLGTVIGMINTFHQMKISGEGVQIDQLSGGIMQAMVTTVTGLIIGIIAYIAYNALVTRVDKLVHKMENSSIEFMDILDQPTEHGH